MASQYRKIGKNVRIHETAELNVEWLEIGSGTIIGAGVLIEGTKVIIGREAWLDRYAYIGGGSAFDPSSFLVAGDFLHMGRQSHINTARGVTIGDEFGCGVETKVFAHGAYLSELDGFPVKFAGNTIGDRVWLPNAWVNPGVTIGSDVVVGARSLVTSDLPGGCLAIGIPCKVVRQNCYPAKLTVEEKKEILERIVAEALEIALAKGVGNEATTCEIVADCASLLVSETVFDLEGRRITGKVAPWTEIIKNQLRRHGIRFKYGAVEGVYVSWEESGY
ncbi:MAG: hypothetical protein HY872_10185 [Chloroflexi bacterium]|nr:hypothetical protein [Chloroflexota bacterium]